MSYQTCSAPDDFQFLTKYYTPMTTEAVPVVSKILPAAGDNQCPRSRDCKQCLGNSHIGGAAYNVLCHGVPPQIHDNLA